MPEGRRTSLHIRCPNCQARMFGYSMKFVTYSFTEITYECREETCKLTCVVTAEVNRILQTPIVITNRGMNIPLSSILKAKEQTELLEKSTVINSLSDEMLREKAMPPQLDIFYDEVEK